MSKRSVKRDPKLVAPTTFKKAFPEIVFEAQNRDGPGFPTWFFGQERKVSATTQRGQKRAKGPQILHPGGISGEN